MLSGKNILEVVQAMGCSSPCNTRWIEDLSNLEQYCLGLQGMYRIVDLLLN